MNPTALIYVFIGGGIGAMLRYASTHWFMNLSILGGKVHWATLLINLLASTTLVLVYRWTEGKPMLMLLLATGLCGGWSTFSTFSNETVLLLQSGKWGEALAYVLGSTLLSVGAIYILAAK